MLEQMDKPKKKRGEMRDDRNTKRIKKFRRGKGRIFN